MINSLSGARRILVRTGGAACAVAFAALTVAAPAHTRAADAQVAVFESSSAAPPVSHVVGPIHTRACHVQEADGRAAVLDRLRKKAAAEGATGVVNVRLTEDKSPFLYIKNGFPNPCRYETHASGTAVVLGATSAN